MSEKSRQWLYDTLRGEGYNVGEDYDEFSTLIDTNPESRKWCYQTATSRGYDVGKDYAEFDSIIGKGINTSPISSTTAKPEQQQPTTVAANAGLSAVTSVKPKAQTKEKTSTYANAPRGGSVSKTWPKAQAKTPSAQPAEKVGADAASGKGVPGAVSAAFSTPLNAYDAGWSERWEKEHPLTGKLPGKEEMEARTRYEVAKGSLDYQRQKEQAEAGLENTRRHYEERLGVRPQIVYNPEKKKWETVYHTNTGEATTNREMASAINTDIWKPKEPTVEDELADAESRLAEERKAYDDAGGVSDWLDILKSVSPVGYAVEYLKDGKVTAPDNVKIISETIKNGKLSLPETMKMRAAIHSTEEEVKRLKQERDRQNGEDVGFWRKAWDAHDWRNYAFGYFDVKDAAAQAVTANEVEKEGYEEGSSSELLMNALYNRQLADGKYARNDSWWGKAGDQLSWMGPLAVDMALGGGIMEIPKFITKAGTRYAAKVAGEMATRTATRRAANAAGKGLMKTYIAQHGVKQGVKSYLKERTLPGLIKATGSSLDKLLIQAPALANTVQAGKTASDVIARKLGDAKVGEDGKYHFENDLDWASAIYQSEANAVVENWSEMVGGGIDKVLTSGAKTVGLEKVAKVLDLGELSRVLSASGYKGAAKVVGAGGKILKSANVNQIGGEMGEEISGQALRTLLQLPDAYVEDEWGNRTNALFSSEFWEGLSGMSLSIPFLGGASLALGTVWQGGKRLVRESPWGSYRRMRREHKALENLVDESYRKAMEVLGEERWNELSAVIDNTPNEEMTRALRVFGPSLKAKEEREAVAGYVYALLGLRGFNLTALASSRGDLDFDKKSREKTPSPLDNGQELNEVMGGIMSAYDLGWGGAMRGQRAAMGLMFDLDEKEGSLDRRALLDERAMRGLMTEDGMPDAKKVADYVLSLRDREHPIDEGDIYSIKEYIYALAAQVGLYDQTISEVDSRISREDGESEEDFKARRSQAIQSLWNDVTGKNLSEEERESIRQEWLADRQASLKAIGKAVVKRGGETRGMEVVGGKVVLTKEGVIDAGASDKAIVLRDPESGKVEMVSVKDLLVYQDGWDASTESQPVMETDEDVTDGENGGGADEEITQEEKKVWGVDDPVAWVDEEGEHVGVVTDATDDDYLVVEYKDADGNPHAASVPRDKARVPEDEDVTGEGENVGEGQEQTPTPNESQQAKPHTMYEVNRILSAGEVDDFMDHLEENGEEQEVVPYSREEWDKRFKAPIPTPIGNVKLGEHQFDKLHPDGNEQHQDRRGWIGLIHQTLTRPDAIIEQNDPQEGAERDFKYVFVKTFTKPDGERMTYFTSITVKKGDWDIVITSHYKKYKEIKELLKNGKLCFSSISPSGLQTEQAGQPASATAPVATDGPEASNREDTTSPQEKQAGEEKSSGAGERLGRC